MSSSGAQKGQTHFCEETRLCRVDVAIPSLDAPEESPRWQRKIVWKTLLPRGGSSRYFSVMKKSGFMYMMTNFHNTVLYTGATISLPTRVGEHQEKTYRKSFASRYNVNKLVHYEFFDDVRDAYEREYQIKSWSRRKKEALINSANPDWKDLFDEIKDF